MPINDMTEDKWAVMVCIDKDEDDWIFVMEDVNHLDASIHPKLFDDLTEALEYAKTFTIKGKEENVQVVNYYE